MARSEPGLTHSIRTLLPYTSIAVLLAMLYAGWTLWSRHSANARAVEQQRAEEAHRDADITRIYGNGAVKIMSFYASPSSVRPGEKALLCYGVSNAKTVTIEPHLDDVSPSISRCLEIHPRQNTEYKLTAADAQGHKVQQSFLFQVTR